MLWLLYNSTRLYRSVHMKESRPFPWPLLLLIQIAYVIWVSLKTYHLDNNHDSDAAAFYRISLLLLLGAGFFVRFDGAEKKFRKYFLIIPAALWIIFFAGGEIRDYTPVGKGVEKLNAACRDSSFSRTVLRLHKKYHYSRHQLEEAMGKAVYYDNPEIARALLSLEVPLDYPTREFDPDNFRTWPWMHQAAISESMDVMDLLLESGVPIDITDARGRTPLMLAAFQIKPLSMKYLLDHGADMSARDEQGLDAAQVFLSSNLSVSGDKKRALQDLLADAGADFSCADRGE